MLGDVMRWGEPLNWRADNGALDRIIRIDTGGPNLASTSKSPQLSLALSSKLRCFQVVAAFGTSSHRIASDI